VTKTPAEHSWVQIDCAGIGQGIFSRRDAMKRAVRLFGASVAAVLAWATLAPTCEAFADTIPKDALYVPGEVVVVFRNRGRLTSPLAQARALARKVGGRVALVSSRSRSAVIKAGPGADVSDLARRFSANAGVRFAEPNYIYRATGATAGVSSITTPPPYVVRKAQGAAGKVSVSKAALNAMKTRTRAGIKATYPSDKLLWDNAGWDWVGASIVWNNTTPSKNVCVIDSGVDYLHLDLTTARVIKGKDRVNEDADPMDDNGHGTLVAGIIAAKQNNTEGIAGVSPTAKVVAVKALNADAWGTSYDIKQAIYVCADRTDVWIINMSFEGPYSELQKNAIWYATGKGKLVVASAGNKPEDWPPEKPYFPDMPYCSEDTDSADLLKAGVRSYPAGFAAESPKYKWSGETCIPDPEAVAPLHKANLAVLSVGAGGSDYDFDYSCRAEYSNFGDWVNITAPGTDILSTTPWDKPFTMNAVEGLDARYGYTSGTSMAAAYVSGVAARAWGYQPNLNKEDIATYVKYWGFEINAENDCWPASMAGVTDVSVAAALGRAALSAEAFDAVTGLPLIGATIQAVQGTSVRASSVLTTTKTTSADYPAGYLNFPSSVDLINIPADGSITTLKVNKSGYTSAATNAFVGGDGYEDGTIEAPLGGWAYAGYAAVPPKSARFAAVSAWDQWGEHTAPWLTTQLPKMSAKPAPLDDQDGNFIVGWNVCADTTLEYDTAGELSAFPYAQAVYQNWFETHQIVQRAGLAALPRYTGDYVFRVYNEAMDFDTRQGSLFIWKDGAMKARVNMTGPGCDVAGSDNDWWEAAKISSGTSGSATITPINACKDTASVILDLPGTCGGP
jgi:subtilisin family serine protease